MTCKDCVHYDVCEYHITEETDMTINECPHQFKNKADFVEVVRCKECKHFKPFKEVFSNGECAKGNGTEYWLSPNHFCSYGERKESD